MKIELPKLLIIGHARHGKDTFAELFRDNFGMKFVSSSQAASDIFIFEKLKDKYGYKTSDDCFNDRANHRAEWYDLICAYNKEDRAKLAKGILAKADCYVGMRDRDEINECMHQNLFDLIVWIDASERLPLESPDSFNIDKSCADIIVDNNGTFEEFKERVIRLGNNLKYLKTGVELIAKERLEQIGKHGRTVERDVEENSNFEILRGVLALIESAEHGPSINDFPPAWRNNPVTQKMAANKSYSERLVIAGALIAAEIDRLDKIKQTEVQAIK